MSKTKEYGIHLKATSDSTGALELITNLHHVIGTLRLITLPFRLYHIALRIAHGLHLQNVAGITAHTSALGTQTAGLAVTTAALAAYNAQMSIAVALTGAFTGGATTATAIGSLAALRGAMAVTTLQTTPGETAMVTRTGRAEVHRGEVFGTPPFGMGGGDVHIHIGNVSLDPNGLDLRDFTNELGENVRSALRADTRSLPI